MLATDPNVLAAFAAAGLPFPVYDDQDTSVRAWRRSASLLGSAVHAVLACIVDRARSVSLDQRRSLIDAAVEATVKGHQFGRLDKARMQVSSTVSQYMHLYLPGAEVEFLGAEVALGAGRADLLWRSPGGGVWADEVKTWRRVSTEPAEQAAQQIGVYLDGGIARFGDAFMGVRVLTLGNHALSVFVDAQGRTTPLNDACTPGHLRGAR